MQNSKNTSRTDLEIMVCALYLHLNKGSELFLSYCKKKSIMFLKDFLD